MYYYYNFSFVYTSNTAGTESVWVSYIDYFPHKYVKPENIDKVKKDLDIPLDSVLISVSCLGCW
jgi:hypothetical protein